MRNQISDAEVLALDTYEKSKLKLGELSRITTYVATTLIEIYTQQQRIDKALAIANDAKLFEINLKGESSLGNASTMRVLATLMQRAGKKEDWETYQLALIEQLKRTKGEGHEQTLSAMNQLGVFYESTARYQAAYDLFDRLLSTRRRITMRIRWLHSSLHTTSVMCLSN